MRKFVKKLGLVSVATGAITLLMIGSAGAGIMGGGRPFGGMAGLALARMGIGF